MGDLIERLEAATVGSIALDGDIHRVLFPADLIMTDGGSAGPKGLPAVREPIGSLPNVPGDVISNCIGVPAYTTSIDAALALAERVLDTVTALALLHAVIEAVDSNGWPSSRIQTLYCAVILAQRAIPEDKS